VLKNDTVENRPILDRMQCKPIKKQNTYTFVQELQYYIKGTPRHFECPQYLAEPKLGIMKSLDKHFSRFYFIFLFQVCSC
jgi:hypothetical protein